MAPGGWAYGAVTRLDVPGLAFAASPIRREVTIFRFSTQKWTAGSFHCNLIKIHRTLRTSRAMAAALSNHVWSLEEIVQMADAHLPKPGQGGSYKKRL
jgi:hypothetical protein